jgi:hypothetical protein
VGSSLTARQERFVKVYLYGPRGVGYNPTRAAEVAGYRWPAKQGPRLTTFPSVHAAIDEGFWRYLAQLDSRRVGPIGTSAPISIVRRAPPTASCSSVSPQRKRTKPSPSLFHSTEERRGPGSCSSFRSREQPHAGFTTVVLGCRTWATLRGAPSRFLARPSFGTRRCRRTEVL